MTDECKHEYFSIGGVVHDIYIEGHSSPGTNSYRCKKCRHERHVSVPAKPYPVITDEELDKLTTGPKPE